MDRTLTDFIRALRNSDVRVSTSESMDAFRAVRLIGYDERSQLKEALSITLAKSEEEKERLAGCFDKFFQFDEFADSGENGGAEEESPGDDGMEERERVIKDIAERLEVPL